MGVSIPSAPPEPCQGGRVLPAYTPLTPGQKSGGRALTRPPDRNEKKLLLEVSLADGRKMHRIAQCVMSL